jgi:2-C-methyl-D-erythritol 4-phosphate cytidylyltransferase
MVKFTAIIPAAGGGSRTGGTVPKQYVELLGVPVLTRTLRAFAELPDCLRIVVAVAPDWAERARSCAGEMEKVVFVEGGAERQESIARAIDSADPSSDLLLVHDAARPCLSRRLIERVVEAAERFGAAIPTLPIAETVKRVDDDGVIVETIPRDRLLTAQTPQGFRTDLLRAAYAHARSRGILGTDDASLVEAYGAPVRVVDGETENIKITYPDDFRRAEEFLRRQRDQGEVESRR